MFFIQLIVKDGGATELTGTTSLTLSISPDNEYTPTISSQPAGTVSVSSAGERETRWTEERGETGERELRDRRGERVRRERIEGKSERERKDRGERKRERKDRRGRKRERGKAKAREKAARNYQMFYSSTNL